MRRSSPLLINEPPLQLLPSLAKAIGLNEALVIQQIHYWLGRSNNERDGKLWVYKTHKEWQEEFPFWSLTTIGRILRGLTDKCILHATDKYNTMSTDRTHWYTIDYERLNDAVPDYQLGTLDAAKVEDSRGSQIGTLLPENTQENTYQCQPVIERHFGAIPGLTELELYQFQYDRSGAEIFEAALIATVNAGGGRKMNVKYVTAIIDRLLAEKNGKLTFNERMALEELT